MKTERGQCSACGQRTATRDGEAADGRPQYCCLNGRCRQTWTCGHAGEAWDTKPHAQEHPKAMLQPHFEPIHARSAICKHCNQRGSAHKSELACPERQP